MATIIGKVYDWGPEQSNIVVAYDSKNVGYEIDKAKPNPLTISYASCMDKNGEVDELIAFAVGCFDAKSNFFEEIEKYISKISERKITIEHKGKQLVITEENADFDALLEAWKNECAGEINHFIIGVKWNKQRIRYDRLYIVKARTQEEAIERVVLRDRNILDLGLGTYECLGSVDKKNNTIHLNNASYFIGELRMHFLEF